MDTGTNTWQIIFVYYPCAKNYVFRYLIYLYITAIFLIYNNMFVVVI